VSSSKSLRSKPESNVSGTSDKNSSKISLNSSPERFKINRIKPMLMSGSEIKQSTPLGPQEAAKILPPLNSEVTMSRSPNSRFLPCSSSQVLLGLNQNNPYLFIISS